MLYLTTLVYLGLVYLRPTELVTALAEVPVVVIASVATAPFLAWGLLQHPRRLIELPQDRFVLGYWFAIMVSNLAWGWFGGALLGFTTFGQVVFQYVLLRTAIRRPAHLRGVLLLLTSLIAFHAASGIVQHFTGLGFGGVESIRTGVDLRIRSVGIFNDPNDLAQAILVVIPFLLVTGFGRYGMLKRTLALGLLVPLLLALYYTNSRGGILGLGAAVSVFAWQRFGRLTGTAAVVAAFVALVAMGPSRLQQMDAEEASAQGRIQAWAEGLQMLKARPISGVGYSRFTEYHSLVAHNSFVHSWAELGLLGGFCFVGMTYWYFESLRRVASQVKARGPQRSAWHIAFVATGVGLFVGLCFLSRQYNPVPYTVLALGACYVGMEEDGGSAVGAVWWRDRTLVLALTFMSVLVAWIAVRLFAVWGVAF